MRRRIYAAFDLGLRYTTGRIQAQLAGWKIDYSNRIVTSFNQDLGISIDRNVGKVFRRHDRGVKDVDASIE